MGAEKTEREVIWLCSGKVRGQRAKLRVTPIGGIKEWKGNNCFPKHPMAGIKECRRHNFLGKKFYTIKRIIRLTNNQTEHDLYQQIDR